MTSLEKDLIALLREVWRNVDLPPDLARKVWKLAMKETTS